ncbi:MinD/ParA family protein [Arthrobacter castelli]|uniref:MinD/ParA family protein n=1 Tax=Arthrobacter castelli TaxID=271431 RepID=UPI001FDFA91D|nr:MinD/ParA family protein [Arthrobacter castelli]
MSQSAEHMVVQIHKDGTVMVGASRINTSRYPDAYTAAFDQIAQEAQRRGEKVLTHGVDHAIGEDTWFYVTDAGDTEATTAPSENSRPSNNAGAEPVEAPAAPEDHQASAPAEPATEDQPEPAPVEQESLSTAPTPQASTTTEVPRPGPIDSVPLTTASPAAGPDPDNAAPDAVPDRATEPPPAAAPAPASAPPASDPDPATGPPAAAPAPAATTETSSPNDLPQTRSGRRAETTSFVKPPKDRPTGGLRGAVYKASIGTVNLGPSAKQRQEDALEKRISRQLHGAYNTAVLSLKGGIGKTSTTVGVGMTLAEFRGDLPCAIDANPDSGDLAERALGESIHQSSDPRTVSDIIDDLESITSLTELSRYMQHAGRFHVLAGEQDPEVSDSLTADEYLKIRTLIGKYYSVLMTDCGTGVTHNAMKGILQTADNLVIAAGYAVSGAKRARSTLSWLASHGYEELARNAIVVITDKDEVSARVNKDAINQHLSGICRQLIAVPHDRGVADGDVISLETLKPATRRAYKEIAAAIVDGYQ